MGSLTFWPRRGQMFTCSILLNLQKVLLRMTPDLYYSLGANIRFNLFPITIKQLQRLEELVVLGFGPALARLGDGVGLSHPPGPLVVVVPQRQGHGRGGLAQAHRARLFLLARCRRGIERVRRCAHGHHGHGEAGS